jgi:hypothetical protein
MKFSARFLRFSLLLFIPFLYWQCDDDNDKGKGELRIELTDAPLDDDNVQGVFVTISEIRIDGEKWPGLDSKTTIDLTTLQNGNVQSLGVGEVDAQSYDRITLVLDMDEDENGNSPGTYILAQNSTKHDLSTNSSGEMEIDVTGSEFDVTDASTSTIVVDFDLRKALRYGNSTEPASDYSFGTNAELEAALRYVEKNRAGHIQGHVTDLVSTSDLIVVYAYKEGEFNRAGQVSGASDEQFDQAVTSAVVNAQGDYKLSWLEEGEYELVFASYEDDGSNGTMDLQGTLNLNTLLGIDIKSVDVSLSSTVTVDVTITGISPI